MKVERKGHTTIIKDTESNYIQFIEKLTGQYNTFKDANLILDLTHDKTLDLSGLKQFQELTKIHRKNNKSLVIVAENIDFNKVSAKLKVVPSILEAHDLIEMDEIERDLGF